jgi:hypothetical protein
MGAEGSVRMTRELPLLYSAAMVMACLAGAKTQTRRVPPRDLWDDVPGMLAWGRKHYGVPGDILYVREAWRVSSAFDGWSPTQIFASTSPAIRYEADGRSTADSEIPWGRLRATIHMPRKAARILRRRTEPVRVERLQVISEADIMAEGIRLPQGNLLDALGDRSAWFCDHRSTLGQCPFCAAKEDGACEAAIERAALITTWARGWDATNGDRAPWAENPPVIVVSHEAGQAEEARAA